MEAKVIRWGDDLAVRLSAEEAEQHGLSEGQTVEVVAKPDAGSSGRPADTPGGPRYENGRPAYTLADMVAEMDRLGPSHRPALVEWGPDVGAEIIDDDDSR
ncbi:MULTISPECIES: AbrB/MazE/SpoVT family DNA-binding domain-containing protein [Methylobacterium]|uniref:MazF family transcriptional regulator n=1 Tax=Methylobacterium thuringiense TaxID=1003091 RepID=A0ABQ4TH03_9HYPH|nr:MULTISPECIES: MazF family transcriptional regulator [Methylobacterium]TXN24040.1 MazF family transcriptional regulator [Methylobacterium sp. WL9]GJE54493.1 hypothetical protein EKPJFOCH_0970 [Methylobacterium thuringiense]